ncbi:MAG: sigma-70 family RNA polymerase sigma factor [Flavobacteriaceae bacterium]|nr:sigma-70 family RNA polymerase sigma factor [Flavobacteriaceae bacterium]
MESKEHNLCKEQTYQKVHQSHAQALYNFIYYKCGDSAKAADVVQEAFIKLWEHCKKVPVEKAKAYLFMVARNNFLNTVKAEKVRLEYKPLQTGISNQDPEFVLEEKQYREKLEKAIAHLSEAQRTAFLLNRIEGKKYKEIAQMLDISIKAVEKRISKALESLRKEIEGI